MKAGELARELLKHPDKEVILDARLKYLSVHKVDSRADAMVIMGGSKVEEDDPRLELPYNRGEALRDLEELLGDMALEDRKHLWKEFKVSSNQSLLDLLKADEKLLKKVAHDWLGMSFVP